MQALWHGTVLGITLNERLQRTQLRCVPFGSARHHRELLEGFAIAAIRLLLACAP
jgi:hypothetical protein